MRRFSLTERALHWIHASAFFALLATGLVLYVPYLGEQIGRRPQVKETHLLVAVAWAIALTAVVVLGDRRGLRRTLHELDAFDATTGVGSGDGVHPRVDSTPDRSSTPSSPLRSRCCSQCPGRFSGSESATRASASTALSSSMTA